MYTCIALIETYGVHFALLVSEWHADSMDRRFLSGSRNNHAGPTKHGLAQRIPVCP